MIHVASLDEIRDAAVASGLSFGAYLHQQRLQRQRKEARRILDHSDDEHAQWLRQRQAEHEAQCLRRRKFAASWRNMVEMAIRRAELVAELRQASGMAEFEVTATTSINEIKAEVCRKYRITNEEIDSPRRGSVLVQPRFELYWRVKRETIRSLPEIARYCGGKDHTSVLNGIRRYEQWRGKKAGLEPMGRDKNNVNWALIIPIAALRSEAA